MVLNTQKPVWTRKPSDVTHEDYAAFYKSMSGDWEDHLAVDHFSLEGNLEFEAVIFVPKRAPHDLFAQVKGKVKNKIKVYVRRVLITEDCADLMPEYLSFVHGVVDSQDLPLNISREVFQQSKIVGVIRKKLVRKTIDLLQTVAENKDDYKVFYEQFSKNIKLGVHEDSVNRGKLVNLLRFFTTDSLDEMVSLVDYVEDMKPNQQVIYYITAESVEAAVTSPFVERLKKQGFNCLLMTEPIDEYAVQQMNEYDGKKLVSVTKETMTIEETGDEKDVFEEAKKSMQPLCDAISQLLKGSIEKTVLSRRLVSSPCCLVTPDYAWSANMERIMKAQAFRASPSSMGMKPRRTLELNPFHPIVAKLTERFESDGESSIRDLVWLLYDTALLASGFTLDKPSDHAGRIHRLINIGLAIEEDEENLQGAFHDPEIETEIEKSRLKSSLKSSLKWKL